MFGPCLKHGKAAKRVCWPQGNREWGESHWLTPAPGLYGTLRGPDLPTAPCRPCCPPRAADACLKSIPKAWRGGWPAERPVKFFCRPTVENVRFLWGRLSVTLPQRRAACTSLRCRLAAASCDQYQTPVPGGKGVHGAGAPARPKLRTASDRRFPQGGRACKKTLNDIACSDVCFTE